MGIFDDMKNKAADLVDKHGEKIAQGVDKAGEIVNDKTGGKHADKIQQATQKAKDGLGNLQGRDDTTP